MNSYEGYFSEENKRKQIEKRKQFVTDRIELLFDKDSFEPMCIKNGKLCKGIIAKEDYDGVIIGCGKISGEYACIYAQDFTFKGGSVGAKHGQAIVEIMKYALKKRYFLIGMDDSGGARIQEGIAALSKYGDIFKLATEMSGKITHVSIMLGPSAGGAAYLPGLSDYVFMVEEISNMYVTGPKVIETVTGEIINAVELGGAHVHCKLSGVAHFLCENEQVCFEKVRKLLDTLKKQARFERCQGDINNDLNLFIPKNPKIGYNIINVITAICDKDSFLEVSENYAPNVVIGFAKVCGKLIGIVANQPSYLAGAIDINASCKAARFVRYCDAMKIPIITFVDTPGFLPGVKQEYDGIIRHGSKLLYAYSEATVLKITFVLRKAYGGAYIAMSSKSLGADKVFALEDAEIAVMGPEAAVEILYRKQLEVAEKKQELLIQKINEYKSTVCAASHGLCEGYIDEIISKNEIRIKIFENLKKSRKKKTKRHGNINL